MVLPAALTLVYHRDGVTPREIPLADVYRDGAATAPPDRPAVLVNMVQTVDGVVAVDGKAWTLGSDVDHYLFRTLRGWADVVVSGAGTLRQNDVIALTHRDLQEARRGAGRAANPAAVVVTRDAAFSDEILRKRFFVDEGFASLIVTTDRARDSDLLRIQAAGGEVDVLPATPAGDVDPHALLRALNRRGWSRVLAEGGPGLNRGLVAAGVVDELFLTVSPRIAARSDARSTPAGVFGGAPAALTLISELQHRRAAAVEWFLRFAVTPATS